jgi:hypothetical protein
VFISKALEICVLFVGSKIWLINVITNTNMTAHDIASFAARFHFQWQLFNLKEQ